MSVRNGMGMVAALVALLLSAGAHAQICDRAAAVAALASASSGDTVTIGRCRIQGPLVVPAGVTLEGESRIESIVASSRAGSAVVLSAGATPAAVESLSIEADGRFGVAVSGTGGAVVRDVKIDATRGVGIGADGAAALALHDVDLEGPVTPAGAAGVAYGLGPDAIAVAGVVANGVGDLALRNVHVSGFAGFGAMIVDSTSSVTNAHVRDNVGVGILVYGGSTSFDGVHVQRTYRGAAPPDEVAGGAAFAGGAIVTTRHLHSSNNEGYGVFHDATGNVEHDRLHSGRNALSGLWMQNGAYLQLDRTSLAYNDYAGLVAIDTGLVSVDGLAVIGTDTVTLPSGAGAGDGVHLVGTPASFEDVALLGNERVGLVATLTGSMTAADYEFRSTLVAANGTSLGIVLQDATGPLPVVTAGIRRVGAVDANDTVFAGLSKRLELVGQEQPCWLPTAEAVSLGGLSSLFGND